MTAEDKSILMNILQVYYKTFNYFNLKLLAEFYSKKMNEKRRELSLFQ